MTQSTNPELLRLRQSFERLPRPSQRRIIDVSDAKRGILGLHVEEEVTYVRPAVVPDLYTMVSQPEHPPTVEPVTDINQEAGEKSSMLKNAYDLLDEARENE